MKARRLMGLMGLMGLMVLMVLSVSILLSGCGTSAASPPASTEAVGAEYLVLVSIDACRPDYLDLALMPHLRSLMDQGVVYTDAWVGSLESNTPAGHTVMSTGSFPIHNGIVGFSWRDSSTGQTFRPTTLEAIDRGEMDRIVGESGVPTLAALVKERWPGSVVAAVSGHKYYAAQGLGIGPSDYIVYASPGTESLVPAALKGHEPTTAVMTDPRLQVTADEKARDNIFALRAALVLFETYRPRALLINLPATDSWGHQTGGITAPDIMREVLETTDDELGALMDAYVAAGLFDQTLWVVTADHGMIPNSQDIDTRALAQTAAAAGVERKIGVPYAYLQDPTAASALADAIARADIRGVTGAYAKTRTADGWRYDPSPSTRAGLETDLNDAYLYLLSTVAGAIGPDVVITTTEDSLPPGGGKKVAAPDSQGGHGPLTWGDQHVPLILCGPGVKTAARSTAPARLVDLAPTISRLMGLRGDDMDGVVLADALTAPLMPDSTAQAQVTARLSPPRDALKAAAAK